jgi:streptomycin 3"-adenylyltransferase
LVRASLERRTLGRPKWEPIAAVPDFVVMGHVPVPHAADLEDQDRMQIGEVLAALDEILGGDLIGAYLHGSVVLGRLRPRSDIDVFAVSARRLTRPEKERLAARLLAISGRHPADGPPRPIELTVVVASEVRPWRYPPAMDFQYGEWWRDRFENGDVEPWPSRTNPDLALLVTMTLRADATLAGPPPSEVLEPVPKADFNRALSAELEDVVKDVHSDTTNVVLTLVRIWTSVVSGDIRSKDAAAGWALPRLLAEHRAVLERARDIYLGADERWHDLRDQIEPFVDRIATEIRDAARSTLMVGP